MASGGLRPQRNAEDQTHKIIFDGDPLPLEAAKSTLMGTSLRKQIAALGQTCFIGIELARLQKPPLVISAIIHTIRIVGPEPRLQHERVISNGYVDFG
jgi:hypothetical protein